MRTVSTFILGMVVGMFLYHGATNYHVIRANDGFHFVRKLEARLPEAYVDVRSFGANDWMDHPQLAAAVARSNEKHLLGDAAAASAVDGANQFLDGWSQQ